MGDELVGEGFGYGYWSCYWYWSWSPANGWRAPPVDLLFLAVLTSSVCIVSELIKMVERLRDGANKNPPTDFFHEV